VTAHPGEKLPGGTQIKSISKHDVTVVKPNGHQTTLMFAGQGGTSEKINRNRSRHRHRHHNKQAQRNKAKRLLTHRRKHKSHKKAHTMGHNSVHKATVHKATHRHHKQRHHNPAHHKSKMAQGQ